MGQTTGKESNVKTYKTPLGKITIDAMQYHRNGCRGTGFTAILFHLKGKRFMASVFDAAGHCAVVCLDAIKDHGVTRGVNSWRGEDDFGPALRQAVADDWADYDAGRVSMCFGARVKG
jgi:hypothetical protein